MRTGTEPTPHGFLDKAIKGTTLAAITALALSACGSKVDKQGGGKPEADPTSVSGPAIPGQTNETAPSQGSTTASSPEVSSSTPDLSAVFNLPPQQQSEELDTFTPEQLQQAFSITTASSPEDYAQQYIKRFEALQNAGCSPQKMGEYINDNHNDPSGYNGYMLDHFTPAAKALNGQGYNAKNFYTINRIGMAASCTAQASVKRSVPSVNDFYETFKVIPGSLVQTDGADGWSFTFKTEESSTLTESDLTADNQYLGHPAGDYGTMINEWTFTNVKETNGSYLPLTINTKLITNQ